MGISISSALSLAAANSPSTSPAPPKVQQPPVQQTQVQQTPVDTVTLTEAQQVYQLYNQGQTVSQIATSLSLSTTLVNDYLGITSSGG
jgi:DNA-binding NarL/FixJ family response regulator